MILWIDGIEVSQVLLAGSLSQVGYAIIVSTSQEKEGLLEAHRFEGTTVCV